MLTKEDARCVATSSDGSVLVGTQGNGLFRSDDGGSTWATSGLEGKIVKSIAFCHADPMVVYAGTKPPAVHRSDDGGRSWRELDAFQKIKGRRLWRQPAERPSTAYVQALACSPGNADVVVAGMEAGAVVRTTDGGATWSDHLAGSCRDCHALHFHADGKHVYEGGGGTIKAGIALSADGGRSWERPTEGLDVKYGWAVAADPADADRVYLALSPGPMKAHSDSDAQAAIFRREGSASWQRLQGGLPQPLDHMPYGFLTHPSAGGYLLAGLSNGDLWGTNDRGDSWSKMDASFTSVHRALAGL
ncbi:MAG: PQQ-binding-like beta-propeller repeat protein [Actinomycetota bacterium]|nr:PQQ-binding-like beta-propeller repeat protein [Actinomycetota bacterium]